MMLEAVAELAQRLVGRWPKGEVMRTVSDLEGEIAQVAEGISDRERRLGVAVAEGDSRVAAALTEEIAALEVQRRGLLAAVPHAQAEEDRQRAERARLQGLVALADYYEALAVDLDGRAAINRARLVMEAAADERRATNRVDGRADLRNRAENAGLLVDDHVFELEWAHDPVRLASGAERYRRLAQQLRGGELRGVDLDSLIDPPDVPSEEELAIYARAKELRALRDEEHRLTRQLSIYEGNLPGTDRGIVETRRQLAHIRQEIAEMEAAQAAA